jgi:hypothetical protein
MEETVFKNLRYLFSDDEKLVLSMELAKINQEIERIDESKKVAMADFRNQLVAAGEKCSELAGKVTNGFEYRDIECQVEYHKPKRNQKTFTRLDTGEILIDLMTQEDLNLFTQPEPDGDIKVKHFTFPTDL